MKSLYLSIPILIMNLFYDLIAECNACFGRDAASCNANQKTQYCASSKESLGTGHCASLVGKFRDQSGNVVDGFYRGCINCAGELAFN